MAFQNKGMFQKNSTQTLWKAKGTIKNNMADSKQKRKQNHTGNKKLKLRQDNGRKTRN